MANLGGGGKKPSGQSSSTSMYDGKNPWTFCTVVLWIISFAMVTARYLGYEIPDLNIISIAWNITWDTWWILLFLATVALTPHLYSHAKRFILILKKWKPSHWQ